MSKTVI